jgi:hypothetical protein
MDDFDEVDELFRDDEDNDVVPEKILLNGATDVGTLLLRYFLSAAIADNNGVLNISRKALAEIAMKTLSSQAERAVLFCVSVNI